MLLGISQLKRTRKQSLKKAIFIELLPSLKKFSPIKSHQLKNNNQINFYKNISGYSIMKLTSTKL